MILSFAVLSSNGGTRRLSSWVDNKSSSISASVKRFICTDSNTQVRKIQSHYSAVGSQSAKICTLLMLNPWLLWFIDLSFSSKCNYEHDGFKWLAIIWHMLNRPPARFLSAIWTFNLPSRHLDIQSAWILASQTAVGPNPSSEQLPPWLQWINSSGWLAAGENRTRKNSIHSYIPTMYSFDTEEGTFMTTWTDSIPWFVPDQYHFPNTHSTKEGESSNEEKYSEKRVHPLQSHKHRQIRTHS